MGLGLPVHGVSHYGVSVSTEFVFLNRLSCV